MFINSCAIKIFICMCSECVFGPIEFSVELKYLHIVFGYCQIFSNKSSKFLYAAICIQFARLKYSYGIAMICCFQIVILHIQIGYCFRSSKASRFVSVSVQIFVGANHLLEQNCCLVWARKEHFVGWWEAETNWLCQPHQMRPRGQL